MLHRSALEDDGPYHSRSHSGSGPSPRSVSRARMGGSVTPGHDVSHTVNLVPEGLRSSSPIKEGLGSLNRWSQSTTSSRSPSVSGDQNHQRTVSKATIGHGSRNTGSGLNELPEHNVPDLRASEMFSKDSSHLDLSFTASSYMFQNSAQNDPYDYETAHPYSHDVNAARASEGASSTEGDMDINGRQHGLNQKTMLSKALQKANTAVLLDNAANFEGAMEAYTDACQLLQLVMLRSNGGDEEKLKLQEIRDTYMIRITELQHMDFPLVQDEGKALPNRPLSQESFGELFHISHDGPDRDSQYSSAHSSVGLHTTIEDARSLAPEAIPPRRQSLHPSDFDDQSKFALVSPRTIPSSMSIPANNIHSSGHFLDITAEDTNETTSWLDTIGESGGSSPSSANSKGSSVYMRRRLSRQVNAGSEADFDAALNAAVDAAYDDGLEPVHEYREDEDKGDDVVANAHRNIELAKQRVREAELEAEVAMNKGRQMRRLQAQNMLEYSEHHPDPEYLDEEAEEEERILEEMTQGFVMDDFEFDIQSKSALPRESDSSNMSGRTWESSAGAGTTLSTLTEDEDILPPDQRISPNSSQPSLPPSAALPTIPASSDFPGLPARRISMTTTSPVSSPPPIPSVRDRRISTRLSIQTIQTTHELKIETKPAHARSESNISVAESFITPATSRPPPPIPRDESSTSTSSEAPRASTPGLRPYLSLSPGKRNLSIGSISEQILAKAPTHEDDEPGVPPLPRAMGKVPSAPDGLNKSGPKPFRGRNVSVPNPDIAPMSPITPWSTSFPTLDAAMNGVPPLPTPTVGYFQNGLPTSGLNLFDCNIHSPTELGSGNASVANAPIPLEPCPESFLLRPFWLMRCLYQTVANPHGGYISAKLFIPRDIWRVKNVKLKAVEDKVSNCDLLTAALLKLAQVDTYDADAVLEEMQSLESILDQVQVTLSKKLGGEVGVQTAMPLFRPNNPPDDPEPPPSRVSGSSSKFTSWKRLRNKTSGVSTPTSSSARESNKDMLTLGSLPMTSVHIPQTKRAVTQLEFSGPNSNYMGALARLFDAAQVIDQIAQQVEDPGLRASSQTHVGLELSTRHAAEFFGFYVCRFALADISLMLDKFIKRGSEWVLV